MVHSSSLFVSFAPPSRPILPSSPGHPAKEKSKNIFPPNSYKIQNFVFTLAKALAPFSYFLYWPHFWKNKTLIS